MAADWNDLVAYNGNPSPGISNWDRRYESSLPYCLTNGVAINRAIFDHSMKILMATPDFSPGAAFQHRPLLIGLGKGDIVIGYDEYKLIVQRPNPVEHGFGERIAVIDEQGRVLTKSVVPERPPGKRLALAAAVNNQQTVIFLTDLSPLSGEELPLSIQIGDEKMLVIAIDDFKTALTIERTEPVSHSVSSDAWIPEKK